MPVGAPGTVIATTAPTPAAPAPAPAALAQVDFESAENYDGLW